MLFTKNLLVLIALSVNLSAQAQAWKWDSLVNNHTADRLCQDQFGHVYSYIIGDTIFNKFSSSGLPLWSKQFPSNFRVVSATCSPDSSIYLLASFSGNLSLGNNSILSHGNTDLAVLKLDQAGTPLWLQSCGSRGEDMAGDICMNGQDILVTGSAADTLFFSNSFYPKEARNTFMVARMFSTGISDTVVFGKDTTAVPGPEDFSWGKEIKCDKNGNIAVLVHLTGQQSFDSLSLSGYKSHLLLKLSPSLKPLWAHHITGGHSDYALELAVNSQDDFLLVKVAGSNHNTFSQILKFPAINTNTSILYSTASTGYGTYHVIEGMALDSCDNIYITGYDNRVQPMSPPDKQYITCAQLSPAGKVNWMQSDSSVYYRTGRDIIAMNLNNCFVVANFNDSLQLYQSHTGPPFVQGTVATVLAIIQATFGMPSNTTPLQNLILCANKNTVLTSNTAGTISWYNSFTSLSPLYTGNSFTTPVLAAGQYTWYAEAVTCTMVSGRLPVSVTVNPLPAISVAGGTICAGQVFGIIPSGAITYSVIGGQYMVSPSTNTSYTVWGMDLNGCINSNSCFVKVNALPTLSVTSTNTLPCAATNVTLTCTGAQSYVWSSGSNLSSAVIKPSVSSTYWVQGTDANGCVSAMLYNQMVLNCTGIAEQSKEQKFSLYPNPNNGNFRITLPVEGEVKIYNAIGETLYRQTVDEGNTVLQVEPPSRGIYFVQYSTGNSKQVIKMIVN